MTHSKSIQINTRFFAAIDVLKQNGMIVSVAEFCRSYDIDPGNMTRLKREPHREFELAFLSYIIEDYGISAEWLLTGRGRMIN